MQIYERAKHVSQDIFYWESSALEVEGFNAALAPLPRNSNGRYFIGSAILLPILSGEGTAHDLDFIDARVIIGASRRKNFGVEAANGRCSGALQFRSRLPIYGCQLMCIGLFTEHYLRGFLVPAFPRYHGIPIGHFADPSHSQGAAIQAKVDLDACYELPPIWWTVFHPIRLVSWLDVHAGCDPGASGRSDVTCHIRLPTTGLDTHKSL